MNRRLLAVAALVAGSVLGGCSTVTGEWSQKLQIETLDAQNRPVEGMQCQVGEGSSAQSVTTPAHDVKVRRSAANLAIACHNQNQIATATVKPRRERMEEALLPFGSVGVFVDHLSGALYGYPTTLRLHTGQHLVLEHGGEAQVASSEPLTTKPAVQLAPVPSLAHPGQSFELIASAKSRAVPSPLKAKLAVKPANAAAKPVTISPAARSPLPAQQKLALSTPAAASASSAGNLSAGPSAPVNW